MNSIHSMSCTARFYSVSNLKKTHNRITTNNSLVCLCKNKTHLKTTCNNLSVCTDSYCSVLQEKTREQCRPSTWENKSLSPFSPRVLSIFWDSPTHGGSNILPKTVNIQQNISSPGQRSMSQTLQNTALLFYDRCNICLRYTRSSL